eukprot:TRINITY_DN1234_c0_g1_i1.p1 TRINITY_DN1234_c0_g1~~TRINITY_DN1234_c0_g1_i1.p1  ORF type:complete len:187 (+),score=53.87 TRINITY_DN1234_c0_g1_i1:37-561(+)
MHAKNSNRKMRQSQLGDWLNQIKTEKQEFENLSKDVQAISQELNKNLHELEYQVKLLGTNSRQMYGDNSLSFEKKSALPIEAKTPLKSRMKGNNFDEQRKFVNSPHVNYTFSKNGEIYRGIPPRKTPVQTRYGQVLKIIDSPQKTLLEDPRLLLDASFDSNNLKKKSNIEKRLF